MATRRQREAGVAPRPAANAGPRNQMATAAARSGPRNRTAAAAAAPARSGPSIQMPVAAPSGPRNQTAAAATARSGPTRPRIQMPVAAPSGPRNQTAAATTTCRPHARNRRALGDIGNQVNAPVVDREANRQHSSRSLSGQPNAAVAHENTIAPAHPATTVVEGVCKAVSGKNKKLSKEIDSLIKKVAEAVQNMKMAFSQAERYHRLANQLAQRCEETAEDNRSLVAATKHLESEKAQKEAEVQQVMEENVRLHTMLDKKAAQLQAMTEQCKYMALNHHN